MFDFRLKVFHAVAQRLSFTKAAREMNITQPAVSKHIKEIEQQLHTRLFERNGAKIKLTLSGHTLLKYTEQLFSVYRALELEIHELNNQLKGRLRLGLSTTIAQYVLPALLAAFHRDFKDIQVELEIHNTESIEQLLSAGQIDLGLIEGASKNKAFQYSPLLKDEIVLVGRAGHALAKRSFIDVAQLSDLHFVLREVGSGTLETIDLALKQQHVKLSDLQVDMRLQHTESIKSYLLHSDALAFLSLYSVLQELKHNTLCIIDVKGLSIERYFYFIQPQGEQSAIANVFLNYARSYNFK